MKACKMLYISIFRRSPLKMVGVYLARITFRCRASNTLIVRYKHNAGTEFEPLLETVVLLLQITDSQRYMQ